jgi:hypothetical protein
LLLLLLLLKSKGWQLLLLLVVVVALWEWRQHSTTKCSAVWSHNSSSSSRGCGRSVVRYLDNGVAAAAVMVVAAAADVWAPALRYVEIDTTSCLPLLLLLLDLASLHILALVMMHACSSKPSETTTTKSGRRNGCRII